MKQPKRDEEVERIVSESIARLMEHVDAVQVFATWDEPKQTCTYQKGAGNIHARSNMARIWVAREDSDFIKTWTE